MEVAGLVYQLPPAPAPTPPPAPPEPVWRDRIPRPAGPKAKGAPKPKRKSKPKLRASVQRHRKSYQKSFRLMVRLTSKVKRLESELESLQAEVKGLKLRAGHCLSVKQGVDVAFRSAMSNTGSNSMAMTLKTDISRWTCVRWEINTHAAILASFQQTYALLKDVEFTSESPSCCIHVVF